MKSIVFLTKVLFAGMLSIIIGSLFKFNAWFVFAAIMAFAVFNPSRKGTLGMNSNMDMRMVFQNALQTLQDAFAGTSTAALLSYMKLTENALRLEQPIVAGQTLYSFPVLNNQGTQTSTEQRMKLQDTNLIYQIGIFTGVAASSTDADHSKIQPLTYPNTQLFPAPANTDLLALYNGLLLMTINNDQVLTQWDIYRHLNAPETQQTAALGAASPGDQNRGSFDGFYPMEPNVTLIGSKDNSIQIKLPTGGIATTPSNAFIIIILRTILFQNSTVVS